MLFYSLFSTHTHKCITDIQIDIYSVVKFTYRYFTFIFPSNFIVKFLCLDIPIICIPLTKIIWETHDNLVSVH